MTVGVASSFCAVVGGGHSKCQVDISTSLSDYKKPHFGHILLSAHWTPVWDLKSCLSVLEEHDPVGEPVLCHEAHSFPYVTVMAFIVLYQL